jgi:hypothetical protein
MKDHVRVKPLRDADDVTFEYFSNAELARVYLFSDILDIVCNRLAKASFWLGICHRRPYRVVQLVSEHDIGV